MDRNVEMVVQNNPALNGAEAITMTVTRKDRSKKHYYIFKIFGDTIDSRTYIPLPLDIVMKVNGKGRNNHYITVAVMNDGYVVHDLNKEHKAQMLNFGSCIAFSYDEAEEIVKFEKKNNLDDSMPF